MQLIHATDSLVKLLVKFRLHKQQKYIIDLILSTGHSEMVSNNSSSQNTDMNNYISLHTVCLSGPVSIHLVPSQCESPNKSVQL